MARCSPIAATLSNATAGARLALVEELLDCTDAATAAQRTTEWIVAHAAVERCLFTVPDNARGTLTCVAGTGVSPRQWKKFCLSLDDPAHPLVRALTNGAAVSFDSARDSRVPLFGDAPFTVIKVNNSGDAAALGLLLVSPAAESTAIVRWVSGALGRCLQRMTRREGPFEEDPRPRREHAPLFNIINAAGDPTAIKRVDSYEQLRQASEQLQGKMQSATAELARQNELLRRQALEVEQASAAKSQFLANVSHELRTPLNAILGYAAMTLQGVSGKLSRLQRRNLSRIDANARHLLALINEILDITRIEAGRMPIQIAAFNLPGLLREVTTELEPIIATSALKVETRVASALPMIRSDRQKVRQIVVNLVSNALKFTPKGSILIRARMAGKRSFTIEVIDTGIGIPKADRHKIFEDFRQVDSTPRRAYGGTGLGLSICRRLATTVRGTLKVDSELRKGSTFTLTLPTVLNK